MKTKHLKLQALRLSERTGLFAVASQLSTSNNRLLMYHRFCKTTEKGKVSADLFEKQMAYLKHNYEVIDLHHYTRLLRQGKGKRLRNTVIITIDDGYGDFHEIAYPILEKHALPATVFLTKDFIDKEAWLWHDIIDYALKHSSNRYLAFRIGRNVYKFPLKGGYQDDQVKMQIYSICTRVHDRQRKSIIQKIIEDLNIDLPEKPTNDYAPLKTDQIREMSEAGISFGAHTCSHPILSKLSIRQAFKEIYDSKIYIQSLIEKPVTAFCYPNGTRDDFNDDTKRIVAQCGFECGVTAIYGMNTQFSDPYELARIAVNNGPFVYFLQDISGFGALKAKLYNFFRLREL